MMEMRVTKNAMVKMAKQFADRREKPIPDKTTCRICGAAMLCVRRDRRDEMEYPFKYDRICGSCITKGIP